MFLPFLPLFFIIPLQHINSHLYYLLEKWLYNCISCLMSKGKEKKKIPLYLHVCLLRVF